jgi:hypothetical protein
LPDLIVQNQNIAPTSASPGDTISSSCELMNAGLVTSDSCSLKYYFSIDTSWDVSDSLLGTDDIDTLQAGEISYQDEDLIIPETASPGIFHILFFIDADNEVEEQYEDNNVSYSRLTLTATPDPLPDLLVENQNVTPDTTSPGEAVSSSCDVMNVGIVTSDSCSLNYYLSTDTIWDVSDTYLGSDDLDTLQGGDTSSMNKDLIIPDTISVGIYYILFFVDANEELEEQDENNNVSYSQLIVIAASPYIIVEPAIINVDYNQGFFWVTVQSNVTWEVIENCSWLSCDPTSGQNDDSLTVEHQQNNTGAVRTDTITVSGEGILDTLIVVQDYLTLIADNSIYGKIIAYPNPFLTHFTLEYYLSNPSMIVITMYNHLGEIVEMLSETQHAGKQKVELKPSDLPAGLYFYKIETEGNIRIGKLIKAR